MPLPHQVLGVPPGASQQEPDLVSASERATAEQTFKEISEAYAKLTGRTPISDWQGTRRPYAYSGSGGFTASRLPRRFSNSTVALIILGPLVFTGVFLGQKYSKVVEDSWRPNGMFQPPFNPWLKDEELPRQRVRGRPKKTMD